MQINLFKTVFYEDKDVVVYTERDENIVFLHLVCNHWSHSVLKKLYSVFNSLRLTCKKEGVYKMVTITPNPKFAKLFNGQETSELVHLGTNYKVIIWDLKSEL